MRHAGNVVLKLNISGGREGKEAEVLFLLRHSANRQTFLSLVHGAIKFLVKMKGSSELNNGDFRLYSKSYGFAAEVN